MKRLGLLVFCVASCSLAAWAGQSEGVELLGAECRAGKAKSCEKLSLLARSDPDVAKDAVWELIQCGRFCQPLLADVARNARDFVARNLAVSRLQDQSLLADIAKSENPIFLEKNSLSMAGFEWSRQRGLHIAPESTRTYAVRRRVWLVERLSDQALLAQIAKSASDPPSDLGRAVEPRRTFECEDRTSLLHPLGRSLTCAVRRAAVKKLADEALLAEIARADPDWEVRRAAVENSHLEDQAALAEVARTDTEWLVRGAAVLRLTDQAQPTFAHVARNDSYTEVRLAAARRLTDQAALADIARTHKDGVLRLVAAGNLADLALAQAIYADLAWDPKVSWHVRLSAVDSLTDQAALTHIAKDAPAELSQIGSTSLNERAASKVTDQAVIAGLARTGHLPLKTMDDSLLNRVTDQGLLADVATSPNASSGQGREAVRGLSDLKILAELAERGKTAEVREAAAKKLASPFRPSSEVRRLAKLDSRQGVSRSGGALRPGASPAPVQKVELVVQVGHASHSELYRPCGLLRFAISPDGALLATADQDPFIKLWELGSGRLRRTIAVEAGGVQSLSFHPDNRRLAVGGCANDIKVFDVVTGDGVRSWQAPTKLAYLTFSPDGRWLFSWGGDDEHWERFHVENFRVWSAETWELVQTPPLTDVKAWSTASDDPRLTTNWRVVTLPGSGTYIVVYRNEALHVWPVSAGAVPASFGGMVIAARGGALVGLRTEWGCHLVTGNGDTVVAKVPSGYCNGSAQLSPDGRRLAVVERPTTVRIFDLVTEEDEPFVLRSRRFAFSPDGRGIVTYDGEVRSWDAETGRQLHNFSPRAAPVTALKMSGDGRWLAVAHDDGKGTGASRAFANLWDLRDGALLRRVDLGGNRRDRFMHHHDETTLPIKALAFDRAGATLFGGSEKAVFAVGVNGERPEKLADYFENENTQMSQAPAADLIAVGKGDVFDLRTRGFVAEELPGGAIALALSPDGRLLAANVDSGLSLWETMTGRLLFRFPGKIYDDFLTFSPDGRWLASATVQLRNQGDVKIWNPATGELHKTIPMASEWARGPTFSPDSRVLTVATSTAGKPLHYREVTGVLTVATSIQDVRIQSFDVQTGERKLDVATGHSSVVGLEASPDGRWLLWAEEEGAVHLWDAKTGAEKALLFAIPGTQDWAVVAPDGFFDGSAAGIQRLAWRFGGVQTAPVEAFFNEFYRPGLLAEILAGTNPPAPADIGSLDRRQASVRISVAEAKRAQAATAAARTTVVRVEVAEAPADAAHAAGSGARDVRLFRNGSLVKVWRGDALKGASKVMLEATIQIAAGENRFTAYCFNRDNIKSGDAEMVVTGAGSLKRLGTAYILAVGVNQYANPDYNLKYAVADAQAFAEELRQQQTRLGTFAAVEIILLLDQNATKANVLLALQRLAGTHAGPLPVGAPAEIGKIEPSQPEDAVFVYYAGHGTAQGPRFYLIPHDLGYTGMRSTLDGSGLQTILAHSISDMELEQAFETVDAGRITLIIDACNSGQALEAEEKRRGPMNSKGLAQLAYEKGMYVLTAAQGYQAALEVEQLGHGLLTYALVEEGLKTPAADLAPADGRLVIREWLDYATLRLPQMQMAAMETARKTGRELAFVTGESNVDDLKQRTLQRPRVFYRREPEGAPFVVATPQGSNVR